MIGLAHPGTSPAEPEATTWPLFMWRMSSGLGRSPRSRCYSCWSSTVGSGILASSVSNLLFEVTPNDPSVVLGASSLMLVAGLLAAWLPARRAARVDPATALRR